MHVLGLRLRRFYAMIDDDTRVTQFVRTLKNLYVKKVRFQFIQWNLYNYLKKKVDYEIYV